MPFQPAPILFPDVELVVTTGLRAELLAADEVGVFVGNKIPSPRRPRMVVVNRDGGNDDGVTDFPRLRVRVWDETPQKATDLARTVAALMQNLVGTTQITYVRKQSGPYDVPDESKAEQRYLLFELRTEGVPL